MYDLIIIGSGIAGYTAGLYAGRFNLKTLILTGDEPGGATMNAWIVENFPGTPNIKGYELMAIVEKQAREAGSEVINTTATKIIKEDKKFIVNTRDKSFEAKSILIATGTHHRKLGLPNEEALTGKGVCYCATCDGPLFKNKKVIIAGGGDSGIKAAIQLRQYTDNVHLITNEDHVRSEPVNLDKFNKLNIPVIYSNIISELIEENGRLTKIKLQNPFDDKSELEVDGLFVEIGGIPQTDIAADAGVKLNNYKYIIVDEAMNTNIDGIFAAGDVTTGMANFKQMITAAAAGAIAANSSYKYIQK